MEALTLKNRIIVNIAPQLGTYHHANFIVPAIWIGLPPQEFICNGLEVLIAEFPETSLIGNQTISEFWKITLTQHDNGNDTLALVTATIRSMLRPNRTIFLQKPKTVVSTDFVILPQAIITYEHKELITN